VSIFGNVAEIAVERMEELALLNGETFSEPTAAMDLHSGEELPKTE